MEKHRKWRIIRNKIEREEIMKFSEIVNFFDKKRWEEQNKAHSKMYKKNQFAESKSLMSRDMVCKMLKQEVDKKTLRKIENGRNVSYKPIRTFDYPEDWKEWFKMYVEKYEKSLKKCDSDSKRKKSWDDELVEKFSKLDITLMILQDSVVQAKKKFEGFEEWFEVINNLRQKHNKRKDEIDPEGLFQRRINENHHDELESIFKNLEKV